MPAECIVAIAGPVTGPNRFRPRRSGPFDQKRLPSVANRLAL